ncbi:MAG: cytochrome c [Rhodospirillales bacterium]|nr:MAG: cytochrome c [Rhodospirillales bacterium]
MNRRAITFVAARLVDRASVTAGSEHYCAHCAACHGAPPGVEPDVIARGMYQAPPDLHHAVEHRSQTELFWIVKNGIKMSGMSAWADHSDEELWPVVAMLL